MNQSPWKKPQPRSVLRIWLGSKLFTARRRIHWCLDFRPQARLSPSLGFPCLVFSHESPLRRKLDKLPDSLVDGKIANLRLAVARLDGLVIRPGECLSYWRQIGKPSRWRGFQDGLVLMQGKAGSGRGGGLCQLSNLLYWMTLHTPLVVTERWRHSYDVFPDSQRSLPFGSGATCVWNYRDLCIENRGSESFQLSLSLGPDLLQGNWSSDHLPRHSYRVYEQAHWFTQTIHGAHLRHNILYRQTLLDGQVCNDEFLTENHALMMYPPFLAAGPNSAERG